MTNQVVRPQTMTIPMTGTQTMTIPRTNLMIKPPSQNTPGHDRNFRRGPGFMI